MLTEFEKKQLENRNNLTKEECIRDLEKFFESLTDSFLDELIKFVEVKPEFKNAVDKTIFNNEMAKILMAVKDVIYQRLCDSKFCMQFKSDGKLDKSSLAKSVSEEICQKILESSTYVTSRCKVKCNDILELTRKFVEIWFLSNADIKYLIDQGYWDLKSWNSKFTDPNNPI